MNKQKLLQLIETNMPMQVLYTQKATLRDIFTFQLTGGQCKEPKLGPPYLCPVVVMAMAR